MNEINYPGLKLEIVNPGTYKEFYPGIIFSRKSFNYPGL
jgi:hypothetical protein